MRDRNNNNRCNIVFCMKELTRKELIEKSVFYVLMAAMISVAAYFIIHNFMWLIGDDSSCIVHTGWGNYYSLSDYIIPETGRFYPLSFLFYNILPFLGAYSVTAHSVFLAFMMFLMVILLTRSCRLNMPSEHLSVWDYLSLLFVAAICIARPYRFFLTTEWATWICYILIILWGICTYYVHQKQSIIAAIGGLLIMTCFCYCGETNAALPFSYGVLGLLMWKRSSLIEKSYYVGLIVTVALFFTLYYILVYAHVSDYIYDASHGSQMSILEVAFRMFYAQKIFWIAIIILCIKAWQIIKHKASFEWRDNLILSSFAYCSGCIVMHLDHTVYYWAAVLCMLPAVIYYLHKWFGEKWTMIIMLALALIMCRRFPRIIKDNQSDRLKSIELRKIFVDKIVNEDKNVYYYAPVTTDTNNNEFEWRKQKKESFPAYIGDAINNHQYQLNTITKFEHQSGIYILPHENEKLVPYANDAIINAGKVIFKGGYGNLTLVEID